MTILDLKKDDVVYGGVAYTTGTQGKWNCELFKIAKICLSDFRVKEVRLHDGNGNVIFVESLCERSIYPTQEDYTYDENRIERDVAMKDITKRIGETLGVEYTCDLCYVWRWNDDKKVSEKKILNSSRINLADIKMPDGAYTTKEECDKANKKQVTVKIVREYHTEVDENEAEYLLENPDEYEWREGDECISSSDIL